MTTNATPAPSPQMILGQMINGYWVTGAICAAARLEVADQLAGTARPVDELARAVGADSESLYRLLRALASVGIFAEGPTRAFGHTPLSEALRTGVPGSMHGLAAMTSLLHLRAWPEIVHSVRTGQTALEKVFGRPLFAQLAADAEQGAAFDAAMAGYTAATSAAAVGAYDFARFRKIVDVGGGNGALLAAILPKTPQSSGVVFDLPAVAERARAFLASKELAGRCEVVTGDFFASVPSGGDAYTMKMILHDWDDARALVILKNVRQAIRPDGRLLVIEAVIDPQNGAGAPGKLLDVNMLVMTGGRERTADEFAALFRAGGFALERIVAANPTVNVIEARPV
jgi:SAM-dependent methyltransferase